MENTQNFSIGIVGGGKAGVQLLDLFTHSQISTVLFLVDNNPEAPAVAIARAANIPTLTDLSEAVSRFTPDFVFEITGSLKVAQLVEEGYRDTATRVFTHQMAYVILQVMEENSAATRSLVTKEIGGVKDQIAASLSGVENLVENIEDITSDMRMLALNARIEAARLGQAGAGFSVIAQQMTNSLDSVRSITQEIEKVNADILSVSDRINASLERLK